MNFDNIGTSICKVINENNKKEKIIYVEQDKNKVECYFEEYVCKNGEYMQLVPQNVKDDRNVLYVTGQSGSGKTTFSKKYIEEYKKKYKKREVYVFSYFTEDKNLDTKYLKRIKLDDEFVNTELYLDDFRDSLILFDDIDTIKNKPLKKKLKGILDNLLELGRHYCVDIVYISHQCNKGSETKSILTECGSITIFPAVMSSISFKYLLGVYFGMNIDQMRRIKKLNSRAVTIIRTYPNIVLYDKGCYVLNDDI